MRWDDKHKSDDIIDRRGEGPARGGFGGGGGGAGALGLLIQFAPMLLRSKFGWVILVAGAAFYFFGGSFLGGGPQSRVQDGRAPTAQTSPEDDRRARFTGFVLDDVQSFWAAELPKQNNSQYQKAKLVLFTGATNTACGLGESAAGPFYCPGDGLVYIDLSFYADLERQLQAGGDFAQAYVIAHEIGHHLQNILGTNDKARRSGQQDGPDGSSVRIELQADCYAGMWARSTQQRQLIEAGDLDEAMTATAAIGDDTLQKKGGGTVRPESFTHGTSAQRGRWFRRGLEAGDMKACDTFAAASL